VWIVRIIAEEAVENKLAAKHDLTLGELEEALCFYAYAQAVWDHDPTYGRRLIARGRGGKPLIAYLKPVREDEGLWECRTAWRLNEDG
ncbi:MAG: hypothetical protein ACRDGJ_08685, partial [Candidatus Limnocylindria bacterium]